jgi:Flp pilus assembly protein protease CpaA
MGEFVFSGVAAVTFVAAAIRDLHGRRIDNALLLVAALAWGAMAASAGLGLSGMAPQGWMDGTGRIVLLHLGVAGAAFLVLLPLYTRGWIGGGDVKMATIVLLWAGPGFALTAVTVTALVGLVLALAMLGLRPWRARSGQPGLLGRALFLLDESRGVPYGVALAVAGLATALHPWLPLGRG